MSDYLKSTNFATKDALPSGNAGKIVKGTEIDNEFNAIVDAVESKADLLNPVFSGLLTTDTLTTGGATNIGGTLAVANTLSAAADVQFTGTGRVKVPTGTTAQRPASPTAGSTRFNTTLGYLENFNGTVWKTVGAPTPADVSDQFNTSTGFFQVPVGTDAQRSFAPAEGIVRYNTTQDIYEGYINGGWVRFQTFPQGVYTISYLVVAGGGAGSQGASASNDSGGGGGAGGVIPSNFATAAGTAYTIVVGAGGAVGNNGSNSQITGIVVATGGGKGGANGNAPGSNAGNGGSGGGAGWITGSAGTGISGQGNNGGAPIGGGGGAGAAGGNSNGIDGAAPGGIGYYSTITGSGFYVGGGGGGGQNGVGGQGGAGNGGQGQPTRVNGTAATANTGGGGGACGGYDTAGGAGGSGMVILSIPTVNYSGTYTGAPVITVSGANTILKFNSSGTYTS